MCIYSLVSFFLMIQYFPYKIFPRIGPTCSKSAATQVSELVSYLNSNCKSSWSNRIWLDIEGSQYWLGDYTKNKNWYQSLVTACNSYSSSSIKCGIYASSSQWSAIFGSTTYTYGNTLPLWYAHYDNSASFSDFKTFGGWSTPHAKQYQGTTTYCGYVLFVCSFFLHHTLTLLIICRMSVDMNYATAF